MSNQPMTSQETTMYDLNGSAVRAQWRDRIDTAERERLAHAVGRARRLSRKAERLQRKAERTALRARLVLARAI